MILSERSKLIIIFYEPFYYYYYIIEPKLINQYIFIFGSGTKIEMAAGDRDLMVSHEDVDLARHQQGAWNLLP